MQTNKVSIGNLFGGRFDPMQFHPDRIKALQNIYRTKQWCKLKDVTNSVKSITNIISAEDIYIGLENISINLGEYIPTLDKDSISSAAIFKRGDILFSKLRPYLNKIYRSEFDGLCSTEFNVYQAKNINPDYLTIVLRSNMILSQTKYLVTGNTLPRLQTNDINNLVIPLPPLAVQKEIVALYNKAQNERIENNNKANKILENIDEYLFSTLGILYIEDTKSQIQFKVNSSDIIGKRYNVSNYSSSINSLYKALSNSNYELERLKNVSKFQTGFAFKSKDYIQNSDCKLITIKNISKNTINTNDVKYLPSDYYDKYTKFVISKDDILIAMTGATIGKLGIYGSDEKALLNQRVGMFIPTKINGLYLMNILNTDIYQKIIANIAGGGAQPNISESQIMNIEIPLPPTTVQVKIAEHITQMRCEAKQLQQDGFALLEEAMNKIEKIILKGK